MRRMVSDTRSSRNSNGCNSRKKGEKRIDLSMQRSGKSQASGSRRSAQETSDSITQTAPSPQSMRKSKRLEKGTPPSTPSKWTDATAQTGPSPQSMRKSQRLEKGSLPSTPSSKRTDATAQTALSPQSMRNSKLLEKGTPPLIPSTKRKSERLEKHNTPSPVGPVKRSVRGKNDLSPDSSGSKKSTKRPSPLDSKKKKQKKLIQVTMESEKAEIGPEVGMKRKKMNARSFMALFKRQRVKIVPDGDGGLERRDNLSDVCSDNSGGIDSEPTGNGVVLTAECSRRVVGDSRDTRIDIDKAYGGDLQKSRENDYHEDIQNNVNMASSHGDNVLNELCSNRFNISSGVGERPDCLERLPTGDGSVCSGIEHNLSTSLKCGNINLLGTCALCSKEKRIAYNSPEQELCSCNPTVCMDQGNFSTCKGRSNHEVAVTSETAEKCASGDLSEMLSDFRKDGHKNVCSLCNKSGELLCCEGKGCKRYYHIGCIDPQLSEALPGVWHCAQCVKKKLLFGVHSVSEGVESIWDVKEVELSNGVCQRQYLVKYHGLAHIHNHWVSERQLVLENSCIVSSFIEKDQLVRRSPEWIKPHRLLRKRYIQDNIYIASSSVISVCNYEWLVKWRGLGYDHATWELDNASWLSSSLGTNLMKDYGTRCERAKQESNQHRKGPFVKLSELPSSQSLGNDSHVLKNVNKLRQCLFKCQNVVFYDHELLMTILFFLRSMSEICRPFLIVTASSSLSQWEFEIARLAPSVDFVVYSGNKDTRKGIRTAEFYDEGGCLMLQVLLSSVEAVFEVRGFPELFYCLDAEGAQLDLASLISIKWEAIVIDDYQQFEVSNDLEKFKMFCTNSRILLVSGQIKDTASEYLQKLLLLESHGDLDKLIVLKSKSNDNLCKLKDKLSRFIACRSNCQLSKFHEYWVPVQLSNYQLEHYCAILLNNSVHLHSCSKSDPVGALRDVLLAARKCCDHPYLLDLFIQERLFHEKRPLPEILEIGIKASGKLELLDKMLTEIQCRGLQVLVFYQAISGASIGNFLDDFIRQRFGPGTYERVEQSVIPSKKQAAANRFNKKETGQFIFLLDNRACTPTIKLTSLDAVIIYNSDWNPSNDLRALQKLSINSKSEQIKVFRLYSSFTVEERALVLAKQNLNLDNNLQTSSRTASDTLLSWGAVHLFGRLDEYHANGSSDSASNPSGQLLLSEVNKEFQAILFGNADPKSVISKVKLGVGSYIVGTPMLGEAQVQLKEGEELHVFWRNLLDGRNYNWRHLRSPSSRNRKRIHYSERDSSTSVTERDGVAKKRKKMVTDSSDPALARVDLGVDQVPQIAVSKEGSSRIRPSNQLENLQIDGNTSNNSPNCISGFNSLGAGVSEDMSGGRIVPSDERKTLHSSLQAEMTRLCQILKFSEEVTVIVFRILEYVIKNRDVNSDSQSVVQALQISLCWIAAAITKTNIDKKESLILAKRHLNYQCTEDQAYSVYFILKEMYSKSADKIVNSGRYFVEERISKGVAAAGDLKKLQKRIKKRRKKLVVGHQQELREFHEKWDKERIKLETDHKLESAFVRTVHGQSLAGLDKLKLLNNDFNTKLKELNHQKDLEHKALVARQSRDINDEERRAASWVAEAESNLSYPASVGELQSFVPQPEAHAREGPQPSLPSDDAMGCETHAENSETVPLQYELGVSSLAMEEPDSQPKQMSDNEEVIVLPDPPASMEQVPDEINASGKKSVEGGKVASPDALVDERCGPDEAAGGDSQGPKELVVQLEENAAQPDCGNFSSQQAQQDVTNQSSVLAVSPALENQNTLQIQTEPIDTIPPALSNHEETPMADESLTPTDNETVTCVQTDTETVTHTSLDNETAACVSSDHETVAQAPSNPGQSAEVPAVSENDSTTPSPVVVSSAEQPNEAVFQLRSDSSHPEGSSYLVYPGHQLTHESSLPSSSIDPLQIELDNLRRAAEQLDKHHKELVSQLQSDCEKEIHEIINQIRDKYNTKLQETETEFRLKKNEYEKKQNKVLLNKLLAAAFRSKCWNPKRAAGPGMKQGVPSGLLQHMQQLSTPPTARPPPVTAPPGPPGFTQPTVDPPRPVGPSQPIMGSSRPLGPSQPTTGPTHPLGPTQPTTGPTHPLGPTQPTTGPPSSMTQPTTVQPRPLGLTQPTTGPPRSLGPTQPTIGTPRSLGPTQPTTNSPSQTLHLLSRAHTIRSSSPVVVQPARPAQAFQNTTALFSAPPTRPPLVINTITPSCGPGPTGEIRSVAPHLQPFRPPPGPRAVSPLVPHVVRAPPQPPLPPAAFVHSPAVSRAPVQPGNQSRPVGCVWPSDLPDISLNFGTLEPSDLETLGNVQQAVGNQAAPLAADVVCLSDDE